MSRFDTSLVYTANGQYGSNIVLSAPSFVDTDSLGSGYSIYANFPGTSAAVPHVTGAIALALHAGYTASGALSLLETYARPGPGQSGRDSHYGFGQVYVGALLAAPSLDSVRYCTSGNYNIVNNDSLIDGHNCMFTAWTSHGAPPVEAKFKVITSVVHDTTIYDWGPLSQEIDDRRILRARLGAPTRNRLSRHQLLRVQRLGWDRAPNRATPELRRRRTRLSGWLFARRRPSGNDHSRHRDASSSIAPVVAENWLALAQWN